MVPQIIMGLERDKSELERKVERSNLENRSTLQMMASLQEVRICEKYAKRLGALGS